MPSKRAESRGPHQASAGAGRPTYHHGDLRQAILDESRRQIGDAGLAGFSLSAVAAALRVSTGAPYHHFRGKDEVLKALAESVYAELLARVKAAADQASGSTAPSRETVRAAMSAACHEFLQFTLDHPALFEMSVAHFRPASDSDAFTLGRAMAQDGAPTMVSVGLLDPARAEEFGSALYVALRGVAIVAEESPRLVPHSTEPHLLLEQMFDALLYAFRPGGR